MKFPWSLQEAEARGFRVRQQDGLTLIAPARDKVKWQYDPADPLDHDSELVWRSALLDEDMDAISLGFPKFPNWGEWGWEKYNNRITDSIANGSALLTAKEDGTLVIRSVHNNRVIWRTRNSFDLGPFHDPVMELVNQNGALANDIDIFPNDHCLFEYVAPANRIVINYERPQLILLATRLGHAVQDDEMFTLSEAFSVPVVRTMRMSARDPIGLQKEITELEQAGLWDCEGLVVRTPEGLMAKIKGSEYLHVFKMRYFFKYGDFAALCLANQCQSLEHAKQVCTENGVDWEALLCAEDWWMVFWQRHDQHTDDWIWATIKVSDWKHDHPSASRKQFADWVNTNAANSHRKTLAFAAYDGSREKWFHVKDKLQNKVIFAPVEIEYKNPWFSLQEEA